MPERTVLYWRRTDVAGLERLELVVGANGITARGSVLCLEDGGFRLDHEWRLSPDWRASSLTVRRWSAAGEDSLRLEWDGTGWRVDGARRPDLDGADEPDLSATPFCNSLPIRRLPAAAGASLTLDTAYVDAAALTVARSRQRYDRQGRGRVRYVDLGLSAGFEADLLIDEAGLVLSYQHLFERVFPSAAAGAVFTGA
ncbi:putative glycolipid-binding domain-containing protein [Sphingosinicella terrae]|uniref:putative glycolipid-binding domain-containing protein n=1 Tax=Sphingosinicella terrae TaxID=2172047 RepID=UPI000E0CE27E|nr:putative glycolipid-binding domain-containing protein [Sphingosinicella terrae]